MSATSRSGSRELPPGATASPADPGRPGGGSPGKHRGRPGNGSPGYPGRHRRPDEAPPPEPVLLTNVLASC